MTKEGEPDRSDSNNQFFSVTARSCKKNAKPKQRNNTSCYSSWRCIKDNEIIQEYIIFKIKIVFLEMKLNGLFATLRNGLALQVYVHAILLLCLTICLQQELMTRHPTSREVPHGTTEHP